MISHQHFDTKDSIQLVPFPVEHNAGARRHWQEGDLLVEMFNSITDIDIELKTCQLENGTNT